jgi:tRNA dimethylallyltransferase
VNNSIQSKKPVICIMGPTASGKTQVSLKLAANFPLEIISVDSAQVYRHMDIGTAKPGITVLKKTPHWLINILNPEEIYSAGSFVSDAHRIINKIHLKGKIPMLVGGTMLYFRSLINGISNLPDANSEVRNQINREAQEKGWPKLHDILHDIDPETAEQINPNDRQRIQRALEIFRLSGKTPSSLKNINVVRKPEYNYIKLVLIPYSREKLYDRINNRFIEMLNHGFVKEVKFLRDREGLSINSVSMQAVGYRQLWSHLDGDISLEEATFKTQSATRQLAKRQLTWLRNEPGLSSFDSLKEDVFDTIFSHIKNKL